MTVKNLTFPCARLLKEILVIVLLGSVLALGAATTQSVPADRTGTAFLRKCNPVVRDADGEDVSAEEAVQGLQCMSYLQGFLDGYELAAHTFESQYKRVMCPPKGGIENEQAARIVVEYLREHPEELHATDRVLVFIALARAFPCE